MPSEEDHSMGPDPEITAVMGLTGFGAGHGSGRSKKRQHDKAFTEFSYADFSNNASGGNAMPLGPRRRSGSSGAPANTSKASAEVASSTTTPLSAASANQGPGPAPGNPTDPTAGMTASEARKYRKKMKGANATGGLAAFLAMGKKLPDPPTTSSETSGDPADSTLAATPTPSDAIPAQSGDASTQAPQMHGQSAAQNATESVQHLDRTGAASTATDIAYFRPSFIEDPWSKLT
ncbi:hypothetical protein MPH_01456 [Macrophomina phaseolina MS6]|uniref:Uncharacterized protein n=2 Tax=Macrophomina phaseolina TaxID=35725 RepID=K2SFG3_MACPH|nr:hypothetical protein MPH_01456 [Macrophomina phaseolina MS6]KAH7058746.1 hypothetical protein B0J12DRAFT_737376 [Macrophomina phaseolina]